jgi:hypothetical protein
VLVVLLMAISGMPVLPDEIAVTVLVHASIVEPYLEIFSALFLDCLYSV